jgi:Uma2 family endonuclease
MSIPVLAASSRDEGYPSEREEKMPQTEWHRILLGLLLQSLQWHYRAEPRVVATGDMFVYWRPGDNTAFVAPDVFVSLDAERRLRRRWLTWQDGSLDCVIELLWDSTVGSDLGEKVEVYRDELGVREYFVFDPEGGLMTPRLRGYRLVGGEYEAIEASDGRLASEVLGLHLEQRGNEVRLWDPVTQSIVPTDGERAEAEAAARQAEAAARQAAEQRIRELEAELARRAGG